MFMEKCIVLIPARFSSTRFPGKPLAPIKDSNTTKTMIQRVYENALKSGMECFVVADDDRIENEVKKFNGKVLRVDDDVPTGSERIILAYERYLKNKNVEYIINVQGDEPLLNGIELKKLVEYQIQNKIDIGTMVKKRSSSEEAFKNPNVVKVIFSNENGRCFYFSRASVPFDRDGVKDFNWYQHIGVYSYSVKALLAFKDLKSTYYENMEKLEQLRALENGYTFGAIETESNLIGVDTPEDILKVEGVLCGKTH